MIEILSTGVLNSVQDLGRKGYLNIGVGHSGAMDCPALTIANLLVGNDINDAGLEIALFPFKLKFIDDCRFALTGANAKAHLDQIELPPHWSMDAKAGQTLTILTPTEGARMYLAFSGGIDVPLVMNSRSTDLKTGFGGFQGRGLLRGDRLPMCHTTAKSPRSGVGAAIARQLPGKDFEVSIRVMPSAEFDWFDESAKFDFFNQPWTLTQEANRMGMRFCGPSLKLARALELFSHGILPGTVQVPPSGQPIVQMAEANTCGGYPKIVNVISADLWLLAQTPIGATIRFVQVDYASSHQAQEKQYAYLSDLGRALAALVRTTLPSN
ncbi:allophanate hydrolase [Pseudomonas agarici]|uniref:Allophanate hydrolase n=1 Tax=Pseudomonas agarici TaxID=46677 RepID=A0A0X1T614_PSEAA|nr:biotin-dependent carboxyltransferase family protein [Pseudomonas agarici]AMB87488.1 allophanate hydrolase [Pseudomonas agarici]